MSNLINRSKTVLLVAPLVKFMAEEALRFDVWLVWKEEGKWGETLGAQCLNVLRQYEARRELEALHLTLRGTLGKELGGCRVCSLTATLYIYKKVFASCGNDYVLGELCLGSLITRMSCFSRILARNSEIMTCLLHTPKFRRKCIEYLSYIEKYENHGV